MTSEKTTILLVEDDKFLSKVLNDRLLQEGYSVTLCGDGKQGLHEAKSGEHQLILLDIMLPGMDGISVLREIRGDQELSGTRVIMLSNLSDPKYIDEAKQLGAEYYVKSATELSEIIGEVRGKKDGEDK